MNLTIPRNKFGFTTIGGETNDMNTFPIKADCGCTNSSGQERSGCSCPTEIKAVDDSKVRYLGPPIREYLPLNNGQPLTVSPPTGNGVTTNVVNTATTAISGVMDRVKNLYATNPTYFYAGGAILLYMMTKKKGKKLF